MVARNVGKTLIDESFISTDAGNGWAAAYRLVNGKLKQHGIPHARAIVTGDRLAMDIGSQQIVEYADFMDQRYGYGDGVFTLNAPIDVHQNTARRYGAPMHIFLMLVNIASMGVKSGSALTVVVPAPPGMLNQVAPTVKQSILAGEEGLGDGAWSIQLRTDKKPREYRFTRVIVMPEGAGAYAAFRFDLNGDPVPLPDGQGGDLLSGRVVVIDLGAGTGDTYTLINGNLNPDAIAHATDDKAGIIHNLLTPILSDIRRAVPDATHLTTAHVDGYLRAMWEQGEEAGIVRISGKTIDLRTSIQARLARYAEWVAANKVDPALAGGADAILMAGGGWSYIAHAIREEYKDRVILHPDMFKHTKGIALHDLNGVGQLAFAGAALKAQQA